MLNEFLKNNKAKDGLFSNTTLPGGKIPPASYYIKRENYEDFLNMYETHVFKKKKIAHLTEAADPNRHSPIKADIDFRYKDTVVKRRYTQNHLEATVLNYFKIIKEWIQPEEDQLSEEQCQCFVFEKKKAYYKNKDENIIKDGFHLIWPYLVTPFVFQHELIKELVKLSETQDIYKDIEPLEPYKKIFDPGIVECTWLMYGSCKPKSESYKLTQILKFDPDKETIVKLKIDREFYTYSRLLYILSMRNREDNRAGFKVEKAVIIQQLEDEYQVAKQKKKVRKNTNGTDAHKNDEELEIICGLVEMLDKHRAVDYTKWIQLVWCCHNIHNTDDRLLQKVVEFSKSSDKHGKHEAEDACIDVWNKAREDGLGIGTLHLWAKLDNPGKYCELMKKSIWTQIKACATTDKFNPYDIAEIVHRIYQGLYICVDYTKNMWYRFRDQRWRVSDGAVSLKIILSTEIFNYFYKTPATQFMDNPDNPDMKKWALISKNANNLKLTNHKENIIKESRQFFIDEEGDFIQNLDEKCHLIGFKNGVYDLNNDDIPFREGRPSDNISMSTGIKYREYSWDDSTVIDIMRYMSQVLPIISVRDYVITLFSSLLNGNVGGEKFYFFTGSGGNSKSTMIELISAAFGDYADELPIQELTQARPKPGEASPFIADLKGIRFVYAQEPEEGAMINAAILKHYSGGDTIKCRSLYGKPFKFKPQFKIIVCCNDLPELPPDDGGVWRRVRVVHFQSKFVDYPDPRDPFQFKKDESLRAKLPTWGEPLMWILLQYYKKFKENGMIEPEEVIQYTKEYQKDQDMFTDFIEDETFGLTKTYNDKEDKIILRDAHNTYCDWMAENYPDTAKLQLQDFRKKLEKRFNCKYSQESRVKNIDGKKVRGKSADGFWGYLIRADFIDKYPNGLPGSDEHDETVSHQSINSVITSGTSKPTLPEKNTDENHKDIDDTKKTLHQLKATDFQNTLIPHNNGSNGGGGGSKEPIDLVEADIIDDNDNDCNNNGNNTCQKKDEDHEDRVDELMFQIGQELSYDDDLDEDDLDEDDYFEKVEELVYDGKDKEYTIEQIMEIVKKFVMKNKYNKDMNKDKDMDKDMDTNDNDEDDELDSDDDELDSDEEDELDN